MKRRKIKQRFGRTKTAIASGDLMLHVTFGFGSFALKQVVARCGVLLHREVKDDVQSSQLCHLCRKFHDRAQLAFTFVEPVITT